MKGYNVQEYLQEIHATYPAAEEQPVIGITSNFTDGDASLRDRYYQQVINIFF